MQTKKIAESSQRTELFGLEFWQAGVCRNPFQDANENENKRMNIRLEERVFVAEIHVDDEVNQMQFYCFFFLKSVFVRFNSSAALHLLVR